MTPTFLEPARTRFNELVATMSERDRKLFVGLVIIVTIAVLGGLGWLGKRQLADARSRVTAREASLAQIEALAAEQADGAEEVARIEAELKRRAGEDLPAFMEKAAQKAGVGTNLAAVREREVSTQGNLEEKRYGVELNKVSTAQLAEFLHAVETDGYPLRIRNMKTRTSTQAGVKILNATFEVSAFKLVETTETPEGGTP